MKLYINVGGVGKEDRTQNKKSYYGGYNGGGDYLDQSYWELDNRSVSSGGGATHIASSSGQIRNLSSNKNAVLVVAGGGGGAYSHDAHTGGSGGSWLYYGHGGNGGGIKGSDGQG